VVDIDALAAALDAKHLHGAAIDVFPVEPQGNDSVFESPLVRFENVILTPHIGGSTSEAQANIGREVSAKLIRYSNNGSTASAVNFPEVTLPEHTGRSPEQIRDDTERDLILTAQGALDYVVVDSVLTHRDPVDEQT